MRSTWERTGAHKTLAHGHCALCTHPPGAFYFYSVAVLYNTSTLVPHKKRAKTETAWCGMKKTHWCAHKTLRTGTWLNKKKNYGQKTAFFTFVSATELSSTSAIYPCLSRPDIGAPIALITCTAVVRCPPISILNFEKRWKIFLLQILRPICLLDEQMYRYFSFLSISKPSRGLEFQITLKLTISKEK